MEFLVEFEITVPEGTPDAEAKRRAEAEAVAAAELVAHDHLIRVWAVQAKVLGLYRAADRATLDGLLAALPLHDWMKISVTPLGQHPNDPAGADRHDGLPEPRLRPVYRLSATLGTPLSVGGGGEGQRRIVPLTGGTFTGPEIKGTLLPGASADWQIVLPDGTALGDIRYTLRTDGGDLLYIRSRSIRHGSAEVLARLAAGEDVDPGEYVFRASTRIETAAPGLEKLNKGIFVTVGARRPAAVVYETYLVE